MTFTNDFEDYDEGSELRSAIVSLVLFLLVISFIISGIIYFVLSIEVFFDYDEVKFQSYNVVEQAGNRDEFMSMLIGELRHQELEESRQDKESFNPSPLLQDLIASKSNYEQFTPTDFGEFNAANQRYLTNMVAYLNYVAVYKPEYINNTEQYHVSYIVKYNKEMLIAMEEQNSPISAYIKKFDNKLYDFVAKRDEKYPLFIKVSPYDLTDYLQGISSDWELEEDQN